MLVELVTMAGRRVCLFLCLFVAVRADVICELGFCANSDVVCAEPAADCEINNSTYSGTWLLSPTICNCCQFCLPHYAEDQFCSRGGPGTGFTVGRCGPSLTCAPDDNDDGHSYCQRMKSNCHDAQDSFDERQAKGEVGAMEGRPRCDGKGMYDVFDCVPAQTCFCQSEHGERLFGEVLNLGTVTEQNMHCGCSRLHEKIRTTISPGVNQPVIGPRCTSDGNFNPVQCVNRRCYCVDRITGAIETGDGRMVELDVEPITELACYDPSLDLFPHQSVGSHPYNYTTPCFESIEQRILLIQESEKDGYIVDFFNDYPECQPDGTYGRVEKKRTGEKICVDERGQQIKDYEAKPNTPEYDSMDCKCAQTSVIMSSSTEQPVCCSNGNYRRIQCRRGLCRCVDSDGRQTETEAADVTALSCYTSDWRTC